MRKQCQNSQFRRRNRLECRQSGEKKETSDRCKSRVYRTTHHSLCKEEIGDKTWIMKKCEQDDFFNKFNKSCQSLCTNKSFKDKNPKRCPSIEKEEPDLMISEESEEDESLQEVMKKMFKCPISQKEQRQM